MSYMKDFLEDVRVMTLHGASAEYIASCHDTTIEQVEACLDMLMDDPDFCATVGDDCGYLDSDCHLEQVQ